MKKIFYIIFVFSTIVYTMEQSEQQLSSEQLRTRMYRMSAQINQFQQLSGQSNEIQGTTKKLFNYHNRLAKIDDDHKKSQTTQEQYMQFLQEIANQLTTDETQFQTLIKKMQSSMAKL